MIITELPHRIGFEAFFKNYPSRNLYTLDFDKEEMFKKFGDQKKVDDLILKYESILKIEIVELDTLKKN